LAKEIRYIFDVDGTLTPSRGKIDSAFEQIFLKFIKENKVYLATGSDYEKTLEQLDYKICHQVERCYNCGGNSIWEKGINISNKEISLSESLRCDLHKELKRSSYPLRLGNHIEERPGLVNFSIVGRNANSENRLLYSAWELNKHERFNIAERLSKLHPDYDIEVAGEIGIDIVPKGSNKSQILKDFKSSDIIHFFGDKIEKGGNDYNIAKEVDKREGIVYNINTWKDTWNILKTL